MPFKFEDAVQQAEAPPTGFSFDDAQPKKTGFSFEEATASPPPAGPFPGILEATGAGFKEGVHDVDQTVKSFNGRPDEPKQESRAAEPMEWGDVLEPLGKLAPKVAYRAAKSAPTVAAGVAGGVGGKLVAGPLGGLLGGTAGAAVGSAAQTLGPVFAQELKKSPDDPDGAWNRAVDESVRSGVFSGAAWMAFPLRFFQGPVKQLAFQTFGIQPGIAVAQQASQNIVRDRPLTENLGQAYGEGAAMTAVPAAGHLALKATAPYIKPPDTPAQISARVKQDQMFQYADQIEQLAQSPNIHPQDAGTVRQIAAAVRQEGRQDNFLANLPPPVPEGNRLWNWFTGNVAPELKSDRALQADPYFAQTKSRVARATDLAVQESEKNRYKWNWIPEADTLKYLQGFENSGLIDPHLVQQYPWMPARAAAMRKILDMSYQAEKRLGSVAGFIENYFPHLWKNPQRAREFFLDPQNQQATKGRWFQKERYWDTIQDGLNAGLELKVTNPEDMVMQRLISSADMMERTNLLNQMHEMGLAVPKERAPNDIVNPGRNAKDPWRQVAAPNGQQWLLAPDVQSLWQNAITSKGLWQAEGGLGTSFRNWMTLKSAWVPIKLGLSLFHPVHVLGINLSNNLSRGLNETFGKGQQGIGRRLAAMPEAVAQSVFDTMLAYPLGIPFTNVKLPAKSFVGKEIREAWKTPESQQTPEQRLYTQVMNESGTVPQLSEQLKINARRNFKDSIAEVFGPNPAGKGAIPRIAWHGLRRGIEGLSSPIFEQWIPNLKAAAIMREAESLFRRRPDLISNEPDRLVAMRAIGKQVDNRFGEMFYGSLFWNRTMKDALIGSFLSLGWNLGFMREFVGGALEPAARRMIDAPSPTRALIRDVTSKTTNLAMYSMTSMLANGLMNYSFTGDMPEGWDYIFPRIGGLNPDGTPRRITNPFYTREVPMAEKNIEDRQNVVAGLAQMLYHKMMIAPFVELGTNRDYFGYEIRDPNAPAYKQMAQFGKYVLGEQFNPMSISGAKRSLELSGKPFSTTDVFKQAMDRDVILPILGFPPAPSYASRSSAENRLNSLYQEFVAPHMRPFESKEKLEERRHARTAYLMAQQSGDQDKISKAAQKLAELGVKSDQIRKLTPGSGQLNMFQRLPQEAQTQFLKSLSLEEFKKYYPKASKATKSNSEIIRLWQLYYQ